MGGLAAREMGVFERMANNRARRETARRLARAERDWSSSLAPHRVVVRDPANGETQTLDAFQAKDADDVRAQMRNAGMEVVEVTSSCPHEAAAAVAAEQVPLTAQWWGRVRRGWGNLSPEGRRGAGLLLVGVCVAAFLVGRSFIGNEPVRSGARVSTRAPIYAPPVAEIEVQRAANSRPAGEVWRHESVVLVPGDTVDPGVIVHDFRVIVRSKRAEGTRCMLVTEVQNATGQDATAGVVSVALLDLDGRIVWTAEQKRLRIDWGGDRDARHVLSQEFFVPPAEWKRVKSFALLYASTR
ncbi:MAG: hypothetical protein ACKVZJ_10385 [Phycisphaerales bacterium]